MKVLVFMVYRYSTAGNFQGQQIKQKCNLITEKSIELSHLAFQEIPDRLPYCLKVRPGYLFLSCDFSPRPKMRQALLVEDSRAVCNL